MATNDREPGRSTISNDVTASNHVVSATAPACSLARRRAPTNDEASTPVAPVGLVSGEASHSLRRAASATATAPLGCRELQRPGR